MKPQPMSWVICERDERWYRAICRFASSDAKEKSHFRIDRAPYESPGHVAAVVRARQGSVVVIWEIHADNESDVNRLDTIAMLRSDWPAMIQLAWMPSSCAPEANVAAQEAGISLLLSDLASLQKFCLVAKARRVCIWPSRP